jgi:hypothetical protein
MAVEKEIKPDLVIIYGPKLRPSYAEMVAIKKQCEESGQKVHLIPPPNKKGEPSYDIEKQTLKDVDRELGKIKGNYTLYLYTHGSVEDAEHQSSVGRYANNGVVNTRDIIKSALKHGNCQGLYDGSCFSGATLAQVSDELSEAKIKDFEFDWIKRYKEVV